jgi:hypothetical protein|tara:strand:- start:19782 stop:20735 length:954 start_codon:yes stop_codon:yes gene_type:complete
MATLAEIRSKLKEQEQRQSGNNTGGDNAIYPFWNIKEGDSAVLRFLPDGNKDNTFFWTERLMIKLPFPGVKNETDSKPIQVQIPCMEMYGDTCNILNEVRGWFKDSSLEDMGRKYWKKRSYLFQGFVVDNPLQEDTTPENPIRRFIIGPQIFQLIKQALMDPDMEELPTDYTSGIDFRLNKTSKGGYADYSTSNWARRERPLNDQEMHAINTNGLFNLNDFLPKKPTDVEIKIMQEMFEASVDGEPYDEARFSQYFRPAGMSARTGDPNSTSAPAAAVVPPSETVVSTPVVTEESTNTPAAEANNILQMIRSRQTAE